MSHSLRLFIRDGQKLDLHIEEVPEFDCSLKVEPPSGAHDGLCVDLAFFRRGAGVNSEEEADNVVVDASAGERVGEDHGNVSGIGNRSSFHQQGSHYNVANLNAFSAQQMSAEGLRNNEQLMQLQAERLRGLFPEKSSGGDK